MSGRNPISRRDFLKLTGMGLAALALGRWTSPALAAPDPPVVHHGPREAPLAAITFDDCYLLQELHRLESALGAYPALRLTFFPVGEALQKTAQRDPELWPRLLAAGHEFGYHSFDHRSPSEMSIADMRDDYARWLEALQRATRAEPTVRFARPPFGNRSYSFLQMCVERGLTVAMWSTDWPAILDPDRRTGPRVEPGDVIIFHTREPDIASLPPVLDILQTAGLRPVTMSELVFGVEESPATATPEPPTPESTTPVEATPADETPMERPLREMPKRNKVEPL